MGSSRLTWGLSIPIIPFYDQNDQTPLVGQSVSLSVGRLVDRSAGPSVGQAGAQVDRQAGLAGMQAGWRAGLLENISESVKQFFLIATQYHERILNKRWLGPRLRSAWP